MPEHCLREQSVLITGGAGFIGTHLARRLKAEGCRVRSLDLRGPSGPVEGVEYIRGDARDRAQVESSLKGIQNVFHFAATVSVPLCQRDPIGSYSQNLSATLNVLEAIRGENSKRSGLPPIGLVFASSAAVYGNEGQRGQTLEEDRVAQEFASFYAAQKHASEQAIRLYRENYGIPAIVFRFFNVFGPGQDPTSPYSGVITVFQSRAKRGEELSLHGGGTQVRDFISVHDIVEACVLALEAPQFAWDGRPINLGTGSPVTIRELAEEIQNLSQTSSILANAPRRDGDVEYSLADVRRASKILGFQPTRTLHQELQDILKSI